MARQLAKNVYVGETLYMAGSTPPKEDADQITNPAAWGDSESSSESPDENETPKGYSDLKSDELEKLVADRELEVTGTGANDKVLKKDMVAALEAADAASE